MAKKEYDAIVIGGGIQGLCLGAYLQRAGMQTAIFERRHEEGGCVCTRETTAPGFMHNHAVCMEFLEWMPFYLDFGLDKLGGRTIYPDAQFGIPFSDGSPPIILYNVASEKNYERSHKKRYLSIDIYSEHGPPVSLFRLKNLGVEMIDTCRHIQVLYFIPDPHQFWEMNLALRFPDGNFLNKAGASKEFRRGHFVN